MKWSVEYSRNADRFIQAEAIQDEVRKQVEGFLTKLRGESINYRCKEAQGRMERLFQNPEGETQNHIFY